jgi:hypothetical protein
MSSAEPCPDVSIRVYYSMTEKYLLWLKEVREVHHSALGWL